MMEVKTAHILRHRQVSLAVLQQDAAAGQCYTLATWAHFTCTVSKISPVMEFISTLAFVSLICDPTYPLSY